MAGDHRKYGRLRNGIAAALLIAALAALLLSGCGKKRAEQPLLEEMTDLIEANYLYGFDGDASDFDTPEELVESLGDPYSSYMTREEMQDWKNALDSGYTGIGARFSDGTPLTVKAVDPEGPAATSGMRRGDVILRIDGKDAPTRKEAADLIGRSEGKTLLIVYERNGETRKARVTVSPVPGKTVTYRTGRGGKAVVVIRSFGENTAEEFARAVAELEQKGVKGAVIDLRGNGGGYWDQAVKTADLLLPECTVAYTEDKNGKRKYYNSDETCTKLKYVLLTDGKTASAAEVVAAAVKANRGGRIVGRKTFGKGLVQKEFGLSDGSGMVLTVSEYYAPDGGRIDRKGVLPDIRVKKRAAQTAKAKSLL